MRQQLAYYSVLPASSLFFFYFYSMIPSISSFSIELGTIIHPLALISDVTAPVNVPFLHELPSTTISSSLSALSETGPNLLQQYKQSLTIHPLATKMITGGTLAVAGDAIAQSSTAKKDNNDDTSETRYDSRRALSFAVFDMCYRALQHVSFPVIVAQCQGQYLGGALHALPPLYAALSQGSGALAAANGHDLSYYLAAMEQTLASQLGIVPFLYYPVFFSLTGFIQGLTASQALDRARETFVPLMKRNLLFWIPVQFVQFGFVEEGLQIPFLSVCGLGWTFILSVMAGSTKSYGTSAASDVQPEHEIDNYCINGNELNCEIDPDHLLPGVFEDVGVQSQVIETIDEALDKETSDKNEVLVR